MTSDKKYRRLYRKRRKYKEDLSNTSWYRTLGWKLEEYNKRLTMGGLAKLLRVRPVALPLSADTIGSILIIRNDAIGDMVLSTPVLRILKKYLPNAKIGVAGSFRNLAILDNDPDVDRKYDCSETSVRQMLKGIGQIRKEKWDVVIPLLYNRKTKMAILSKLMAPHGCSSTVLMRRDPIARYRNLFSSIISTPYSTGEVRMIDVIRIHIEGILGIKISEEDWRLSLFPDPNEVALMKSRISELLMREGVRRMLHMHLEAKTPFKEYGLEQTFELSKALLLEYPDALIAWTGSPVAAPKIISFLSTKGESKIQFVTTDNIHQLVGLIRASELVITPDTSIVHIASAERKPVVGLFPRISEWPPYGIPSRVLIPVLGEPVSSIPMKNILRATRELLTGTDLTQTCRFISSAFEHDKSEEEVFLIE